METFPEIPVDAYVPPCGFRETDHAKFKIKKPLASCSMAELTRFTISALSSIAFESSNDLSVFEVPKARGTLNAVIKRFITIQRN